MKKTRKVGKPPALARPYGVMASAIAPPPALNAEEKVDRRNNAVNHACRILTAARKAQEAALAKFDETSPSSPQFEEVSDELRGATRELIIATKMYRDACANLS